MRDSQDQSEAETQDYFTDNFIGLEQSSPYCRTRPTSPTKFGAKLLFSRGEVCTIFPFHKQRVSK